jgi:hypothetical protein
LTVLDEPLNTAARSSRSIVCRKKMVTCIT